MTLRVAHVVQRLAPGGLEVLAVELARQLAGEHFLVSLEGDASSLKAAWPRLEGTGPNIFGLAKSPGIDLGLVLRLKRLFCELSLDAVVTHHVGPLVYAGPAARLSGVGRLVHVEHDVWHYAAPRRRLLVSSIARVTRPHVVCVSEAMRLPLLRTFRGLPVDVIANGVDLDRFCGDRRRARRVLGIEDDVHLIGAVGRLEWVKGHDVLIRAVAMLEPKTRLLIVGDGSRRNELEDLARTLGVTERVGFLGHRDDAALILPALDVFCQPSRSEGLPLAILEAQACGIPVVASDVGGAAAAVCPKSGILTRPDDVTALATALRAALDAPAAVSPRAFVAARFDWRQTLAGYSKLLGA